MYVYVLHIGRESAELYEKLSRLPKNRRDDAQRILNKLPPNSPLHKIPKEHLCQSFMPACSDLHGNRTNNMAEVLNKMLLQARRSDSLLDALLQTIQLLHQRHVKLYDEVCEKKRSLLGLQNAGEVTRATKFPEGSVVHKVAVEHTVQSTLASKLGRPLQGSLGSQVNQTYS